MERLELAEGTALAFHRQEGDSPPVLFLPGLLSDMEGTKARFLAGHLAERGRAYLRFDYRGHGRSSGRFENCTLGDWLEDALNVLTRLLGIPALLVGSSMGGWIALLCAKARPELVEGLVLIAPAPDFTERLLWQRFSAEQRRLLQEQGVIYEPSDYGDPVPITMKLIEEGRRHLLLEEGQTIPIRAPVHILHGQQDRDVPFALSLELSDRLASPDVTVELIKSGDHRLSRPEDLKRLARAVDEMWERIR